MLWKINQLWIKQVSTYEYTQFNTFFENSSFGFHSKSLLNLENGNSLDNFTPRGIEEWQFNILQGLMNTKSTPRGPRGILRSLKVEMGCYGLLWDAFLFSYPTYMILLSNWISLWRKMTAQKLIWSSNFHFLIIQRFCFIIFLIGHLKFLPLTRDITLPLTLKGAGFLFS